MVFSFIITRSLASTSLALTSNCSYTKFLVDKDGVARKRYKPSFNPADFEAGACAGAGVLYMSAPARPTHVTMSAVVQQFSAVVVQGLQSADAAPTLHTSVSCAHSLAGPPAPITLPPNTPFAPSSAADVRLLLAGKEPLPAECIAHPGRKVCKVDV